MMRADDRIEVSAAARAALDVLVFAPLGFGAMLIEDSPAAVRRVRQELSNARFIGRFAVDQGVAEMRSRIESTSSPLSCASPRSTRPGEEAAPQVAAADSVVGPEPSDRTDVVVAPVGDDRSGGPVDDLPDAAELALPDYDTLPAIDIVAKLATLGEDDRRAIERYESAHRQRRTVLGKLAQLAGQ